MPFSVDRDRLMKEIKDLNSFNITPGSGAAQEMTFQGGMFVFP